MIARFDSPRILQFHMRLNITASSKVGDVRSKKDKIDLAKGLTVFFLMQPWVLAVNTDDQDSQPAKFAYFHKYCVEFNTQLYTFTKESAPSISAFFFTIKIIFQKDKHLVHFDTLLRFV